MSDVDQSGSVWAVAITFSILTWTTLLLRVYVRAGTLNKFWWDDWAAVAAQIFFSGYLICQFGGVVFGTGRRLSIISYENATTALKFWFFCEVWYALAGAACKVSICLSLLRVTVSRTHIWIIYGLMVWSIMLGCAFFLGVIFQCIPATDWWDLNPAHKRCLPVHIITSLIYFVSACNVACDWTLGIFPFVIVKDLQIPMAQKIQVASILAFGALASTATCIRVAYLPSLENTYLGWNGDFLYDTTPIAILCTIEYGIAITAMCLATLRPLVQKIFGIHSSYTGSDHRRSQAIYSPYSSADCPPGSSPIEFVSFRDARANALAIIDASDDDLAERHSARNEPSNATAAIPPPSRFARAPPKQYTQFSQFNMTKAMSAYAQEQAAESTGSLARGGALPPMPKRFDPDRYK